MRTYLDNKLLKSVSAGDQAAFSFMEACAAAGIVEKFSIAMGWPALFSCLDVGHIFYTFPPFHAASPLFSHFIAAIENESSKDTIFHLYDQVFVECLTQVKALPQIQPAYLLEKIRAHLPQTESLQILFSESLTQYEKSLVKNPYDTVHGLTLYLAWDRVCVYLAHLLEHPYSNTNSHIGLNIVIECLLESFQHITGQGRTAPGFFRLAEALYAFMMRDENLQGHPEEDWQILTKAAQSLRSREELPDVVYIDAAIFDGTVINSHPIEFSPLRVFTLDPMETVVAGYSLANLLIKQLRSRFPEWRYILGPAEIVTISSQDGRYSVDSLCRT